MRSVLRQHRRGSRALRCRGIARVVDGFVRDALASPAAKALGGDSEARLAEYERQKAQVSSIFRDSLNSGFRSLDVGWTVTDQASGGHVGKPHAPGASETDLRRRLVELQLEIESVVKQLEQRRVPAGAAGPREQEEAAELPEAAEADMMSTHEGEQYVEADALTRRLRKWWTEDASTEVPYAMLSSFELYPQWMPWCESGTALATSPGGAVTKAAVGFGVKVPFLGTLGDKVEYDVELEPPADRHGPARIRAINHGAFYMRRLVYDWRFVPSESGRTKVCLDVEFQASAAWYLPLWEAIRHSVVGGTHQAFRDRVIALQLARGGDEGRPEVRPRLVTLTAVLQGPFLRDEAVVVTAGNGRNILYANNAFARLAGYSGRPRGSNTPDLLGKDVPDLLQSPGTDRDVLRGLGRAVRARLPATATVLNRNKSGQEFMNRLKLAPLDDDVEDSGVVFWAVMKAVDSTEQRLEQSVPGAMDEHWSMIQAHHPRDATGRALFPTGGGVD